MAVSKVQSVLITGANRGLGLEMVRQLAESSGPARLVFATCRDPNAPKSKDLQELAKKHPKVVTVLRLDATDPRSVKEASNQVGLRLQGGGLNLLVNNAGVLTHGTLQTTSSQDMQDAFNSNVLGPMCVTKEFLPYLRTAAQASGQPGMSCRKAAVINISTLLASMASVSQAYAFFPAFSYRVSKAGLNMLNQCAVEEFRKDEILFAVLHPGWVRTQLGGKEADIDAAESVRGMLRVMESLTEKQNGAFLDYQGKSLPW
ncbi:C-factor-like isoform X2 [Megalops cyprinoides]|uniref:C-factor-like isoform X1 n=1 Tax=Megalops cyprinoides TaxID=118141 RepID=UPI001863B7DD|nr:C-factor-like isoform X1 [Megalops cyprinoides]XP_036409162.1 C-factor-like isoform X2 [Megalops cyprinoides]